MTKTYDIIHLPDGYMYAVDKEVKPLETDYYYDSKQEALRYGTNNTVAGGYKWKIIATNNPTFGLPLLSEIEENIDQIYGNYCRENPEERIVYNDFEHGYKAAKAKQYTEEDMRNAFNSGQICEYEGAYDKDSWFNGFIQTLSPKPIAIEIEMIYDYSDMEEHCEGGTLPSAVYGELQLKLTNNNEVIVKQWIYE